MAVVINTISINTFSVNGVVHNKIYQPLKAGVVDVGIYNSFDTRFQLLPPTPYTEFTINGATLGSQIAVITALLPVMYSLDGEVVTPDFASITGDPLLNVLLSAEFDKYQLTGAIVGWADITGKPTTLSGFGITDSLTFAGMEARYSQIGHTHTTAQITNLAAYTGFDGRYLGINAKATDSDLLDGYNPSFSNTVSTVALRDNSGDLTARLFRSEYDTTNASIGFIMTQVDTASNNYMRPSTPAQFRAAVIDGNYLAIGGTAVNAGQLDGIDSSQFLRSDQNATTTFNLTAGAFITGSWTIDQSGTSLVFKYAGVTKLTLTSAGNLTAVSNVIAG